MNSKPVRTSIVVFALLITGLAACGTPASPTAVVPTQAAATAQATGAASHILVIGDVNSSPTTSVATIQPFADYLASKLAAAGITGATVKVAPDFDTIANWLKSGEVDLIFQTPYPAVLLEDAAGAKSVLRRWRNGDAEYYTVIFVRADSGIKTITDLNGKMLAVQDEYSTTAYMMPLAYTREAGLKLTRKTAPTDPVAADEVGYTNSNSDDNTLQWVISGKVAAGATDNRSYEKLPAETRKDLVVLAKTEAIPRNLLVVSPKLDPDLLAQIKAVLLDMDKTPDGQDVLAKFQKTTKFDELPGGADAALKRVRELARLLKPS